MFRIMQNLVPDKKYCEPNFKTYTKDSLADDLPDINPAVNKFQSPFKLIALIFRSII